MELANEISELLRQSSGTTVNAFFHVLDRITDTSAANNQPCDDAHPWPEILVKGSIDELAGQLNLRVTATRTSSMLPLFDRSIPLPMSPAMEASSAKRLTPATGSEVWLRPGYDPDKDAKSEVFRPEPKGENFTLPSCIDCPRSDDTDEALKQHIQGTVTLRVLVSKEGEPLKIVLVDGLPCGMSRRAMEAVARWRLHPAKDSNGAPIEVWQTVEVTSQLY